MWSPHDDDDDVPFGWCCVLCVDWRFERNGKEKKGLLYSIGVVNISWYVFSISVATRNSQLAMCWEKSSSWCRIDDDDVSNHEWRHRSLSRTIPPNDLQLWSIFLSSSSSVRLWNSILRACLAIKTMALFSIVRNYPPNKSNKAGLHCRNGGPTFWE